MKLNSDISAIITGGASGLGEATARMLAAKGVKIALFDLNAERGNALAEELNGAFFSVDVCDTNSVAEGFAGAAEKQGVARLLVNCAGIGPPMKTVSRDRETVFIGGPMPAQ